MKLLVSCPKCQRFHRIEVDPRRKAPPKEDLVCWYCKKGIPIQPIQPRREEK